MDNVGWVPQATMNIISIHILNNGQIYNPVPLTGDFYNLGIENVLTEKSTLKPRQILKGLLFVKLIFFKINFVIDVTNI